MIKEIGILHLHFSTLHTLSAVTDRNIMAKVLEAVQLSGSLPENLNLQNKLKQVNFYAPTLIDRGHIVFVPPFVCPSVCPFVFLVCVQKLFHLPYLLMGKR